MSDVANDPYVTSLRDWWGISWRMFIANRIIDAFALGAIFWFGGSTKEGFNEAFWIMMAAVIGFGIYVVVRDWFASFMIGGGRGEEAHGHENLAILHALRRMKITPEAISPARIDGLQYAIDSFMANERDKIASAMLFGIIKGRGAHMSSGARHAYEDSVDRSILRYVQENSVPKNNGKDE